MFDMNGIKLTSNKANVIHVIGTVENEGQVYDYIYKFKAKVTQEAEANTERISFMNYCLEIAKNGALVICNNVNGTYKFAYISTIINEADDFVLIGFTIENSSPTIIGISPVIVNDEIYITFTFPK